MICKCKKCDRRYEYNARLGYATDICSPFCDGILQGQASSAKRIAELEAVVKELVEQCGLFGTCSTMYVHGTRLRCDSCKKALVLLSGKDGGQQWK